MLLTSPQIDPALLPFLDASDAPEEASALARLNAEQIEPTIRRGLGFKLRLHRPQSDQNRHELEEIYNDIQLRLIKRLRALKEDPALEAVLVEETGGTLTADQKAFRDAWLGSKQK